MVKDSDAFINKLLRDHDCRLIEKRLDDPQLDSLLINEIKKVKNKNSAIIVLVGGVASGKTTLTKRLLKKLKTSDSISTDAFSARTREYRHKNYGNIDKKYDLILFKKKVNKFKALKPGQEMRFPIYDE